MKCGEAIFDLTVPYKLYETGKKDDKPLIVYLHGFKQNAGSFKSLTSPLSELQAYHLYPQGPYPLYNPKQSATIEQWGRAWYLYDGRAKHFISSLEESSQFIERLLEDVYSGISPNRIAVFGYSMGAYLAGYYGLTRPKAIDELITVGGRIKTEVIESNPKELEHINVLALHGRHDRRVRSKPQKESCDILADWGVSTTFEELEEGHKLTHSYLNKAKDWLAKLGYEPATDS